MAKIHTGDLVCLYRRKERGVGIVLERVTLSEEKIKIIEIARQSDWKQKAHLKRRVLAQDQRTELVEAAFLYNLWQANAKLKTDFVYIKWFRRPSEYEQLKTTSDADWFPLDWVGRIQ